MDVGINKNHHISPADAGLVLLVFFLLSFVNHAYADGTRDKLLAKKFAPIMVLTEHPTISGRIVLNPEPVEIMGADSLSNVTVVSLNTSGSSFLRASYLADWNPPLNFPRVDAARNQFAFLTTQRRFYDGIRPGETSQSINMWVKPLFFDYPGDDRASWNPAYLGTGGNDAKAGWRFKNSVYARVFERPDSSDGKGSVFITYFTFYPFNDWKNNHEGDWQKINVMVTSRDPDAAEIFGIDYLFHGQSITYYDITDSLSSINIEERVSPVGGDHPVIYVSAGGHGGYPTPGNYPDAGKIVFKKGFADDLTPNGLVLHPEIVDSDTAIAQSYDLVMLPQPDTTLTNMGLPDSMSWLGADLFWGTPNVASPADWLPNEISPSKLEESNDAAIIPFRKGSWGKIRYDKSDHDKYDRTKIPDHVVHA